MLLRGKLPLWKICLLMKIREFIISTRTDRCFHVNSEPGALLNDLGKPAEAFTSSYRALASQLVQSAKVVQALPLNSR